MSVSPVSNNRETRTPAPSAPTRTNTPSASPTAQPSQRPAPTRDHVQISDEARSAELGGSQLANAIAQNYATPPAGGQDRLQLGQGELLSRRRRSSGDNVSQLQRMLNSRGARLDVDGQMGRRTEAAVRQFQRQNGLRVDGIVGPETMGALNGTSGPRPQGPQSPQGPQRPQGPHGPRGPRQGPRRPQGPNGPQGPRQDPQRPQGPHGPRGQNPPGPRPGANPPAQTNPGQPLSEAQQRQANFINDYLRRHGGGRAADQNFGERAVRYGQQYNVDPRILLAIARQETQFGTRGVGLNGILGVGAYDHNPRNATRNPRFAGVDNQLRVGAQTFARLRARGGAGPGDSIMRQIQAAHRGGWTRSAGWDTGVMRAYQQILAAERGR